MSIKSTRDYEGTPIGFVVPKVAEGTVRLKQQYHKIMDLWAMADHQLLLKLGFAQPVQFKTPAEIKSFINSTIERVTSIYNRVNPFLMGKNQLNCRPSDLILKPPILLGFLKTADEWEDATKFFCGSVS